MKFSDYLAGLIDGEGYIALLPVKTKAVKSVCFEPVVKIGMTGIESKLLFDDIQSTYGGHVERRRSPSKGGREVYTYILKGKSKVATLLEDIADSLYIKDKQAKLLLEYCYAPPVHTRYKSYNPKQVERNVQIYNELKQLKQPAATTK